MAKASRFRASRLERRKAFRDPRARCLIISEGRNSEPLYFAALGRTLQTVVIEFVKGAGTPDVLAETAIKAAQDRGHFSENRRARWFAKNDQVWVVFDRDEHIHHDAAVATCDRYGIRVARSNPCFEVWLILHVEDYHRPEGREEAFAHFCKLRPTYKPGKGREFDFDGLMPFVPQAELRAAAQRAARAAEGQPYGPPSTTVDELTKSLRGLGRDER